MLLTWNKLFLLIHILFYWICLLDSAPIERKVDYTGHKVLRVYAETREQMWQLSEMEEDPWTDVDFWTEPAAGLSVDLRVSPEMFNAVTSRIVAEGMTYEVTIEDVGRLIEEQNDARKNHSDLRSVNGRYRRETDFLSIANLASVSPERTEEGAAASVFHLVSIVGTYPAHRLINTWLEWAKMAYPDIVDIQTIGRSFERREMKVIKIGKNTGRSKPAIWIDAGIHAREWIAPATAVYVINALLTNYNENENITRLVDNYDWYILPVLNPDGYAYSMGEDRMWRKTRSRTPGAHARCQGVDSNRNFGFKWLGNCTSMFSRCGSNDPCRSTYAGPEPFSEIENQAARDFILQLQDNFVVYLSFHSYSQMWLTPWGYTDTQPGDNSDLMRVANRAVAALSNKHGTAYRVGSPAVILYRAGGTSYDWAKAVAGIKYSYTLELRDTGHYGFLLPESMIIPTGEETWAGIQVLATELLQEFDVAVTSPSTT